MQKTPRSQPGCGRSQRRSFWRSKDKASARLMTNLSIIRSVAVLLAIFVTGLLAGVMLGVGMAQQTAQKLPEAAWTLRQQKVDALLPRVLPFTLIAMMLLLIESIFLLHGRSRMAIGAATVAALTVIIVPDGWEVRMNNEIVN